MPGNNFVITIWKYVVKGAELQDVQDGGMILHFHPWIPQSNVSIEIGSRNTHSRIIPPRVRLPCQTNETAIFSFTATSSFPWPTRSRCFTFVWLLSFPCVRSRFYFTERGRKIFLEFRHARGSIFREGKLGLLQRLIELLYSGIYSREAPVKWNYIPCNNDGFFTFNLEETVTIDK